MSHSRKGRDRGPASEAKGADAPARHLRAYKKGPKTVVDH